MVLESNQPPTPAGPRSTPTRPLPDAQVFFLLMALCACCSPVFNNGFWGFKMFLWTLMLIASIFISNNVFDSSGYVWVARVGAFIFTIMQQVVLIDLAYRCAAPLLGVWRSIVIG